MSISDITPIALFVCPSDEQIAVKGLIASYNIRKKAEQAAARAADVRSTRSIVMMVCCIVAVFCAITQAAVLIHQDTCKLQAPYFFGALQTSSEQIVEEQVEVFSHKLASYAVCALTPNTCASIVLWKSARNFHSRFSVEAPITEVELMDVVAEVGRSALAVAGLFILAQLTE